MKPYKFTSLLFFAAILSLTGCSINRPVSDDYGQYLKNNQTTKQLPRTSVAEKYYLPPETQNHRYEFRSFLTGQANLWIVEFGKILDETMASQDVIDAFGKLPKSSQTEVNTGDSLIFTLKNYTFVDHAASITMDISVKRNGTERFNKTYHATGLTQGGKMFWGGVFGMKNAVQQSTKSAIDEMMSNFIKDITTNFPDTAR